jgi:LCP family protein required for cell wall assembly
MELSRKQQRVMKKRRKKNKLIFTIVLIVLATITTGVVYGYNLYSKAEKAVDNAYQDDGRDKSKLRETEVNPIEDHVSILFIGVDASEHRANEDNALSDALILATLNREDNSVILTSIPRDTYTNIPHVGYNDKITHAHAFGGPLASVEAVEELFDVPVDYWVRFNFHAFVDIVDALDGITFDVPYEFTESNSDDVKNSIHLYPGEQQVDGEEALALARTRKLDSDFARGKRQQELIQAIVNRAVSIGSLNKLDDVIDAVGDNMKTNLLFSEIKSFASYGLSGKLSIDMMNLEGSDLWLANSHGQEIYYFDVSEESLNETKLKLKNHLNIQ